MNILICSKLFFPANEIGAVRVTNLAKSLNEFGHTVTVITGSSDNLASADQRLYPIKVIRVSHSEKVLKMKSKIEQKVFARQATSTSVVIKNKKKKSPFSKTFPVLRNLRLQIYNLYLQLDWFNEVKKTINGQLPPKQYDIVVSSFGPLGSHLAGWYAKKKNKAKGWIADLRDNMQTEEYSAVINLIYSHFEKEMIKKADAVTVVSKGQRNMLQKSLGEGSVFHQKVHILYNGYERKLDIEPIENSDQTKEDRKALKLVYTGALYNGKRDMSMLFKALKELILEQKLRPDQVEVHYAGKNSSDLNKQALESGLEEIVKDHGYLTRPASLRLQQSADVLIVLSWNTIKEQGILSGKFFEYMQALKPMISIVNGNLPGAELSEMVETLHIGIGCEVINEKIDLPRLKNYLCCLYDRVINGHTPDFYPDVEKIKSFQYEKIGRKFEEICMIVNQKSF